jgi:hypothetical protein
MKINVGYIALGVVFLFFSYVIFQIAIPWVEFNPFPSLTTVNPFEPIAFVLAGLGVILLIFGLTSNAIIRLLVSIITLIVLVALFKGWINLEWLRNIPI